jgi:ABC-type amino acid transport substrate-binding protein
MGSPNTQEYRRCSGWRLVTLALAVLPAVLGYCSWRTHTSGLSNRIYRIGADHAPPYYYLRPNGKVEGLAVDILNAAAKGAGVRLQWIPIHGNLDEAFDRHMVDLWPAVSSTVRRRSKYHLTTPWLQNNYCLISRTQSRVSGVESLKEQKVAFWRSSYVTELAKRALPQSIFSLHASRQEAIETVCRGEAKAALVETRFVDSF